MQRLMTAGDAFIRRVAQLSAADQDILGDYDEYYSWLE